MYLFVVYLLNCNNKNDIIIRNSEWIEEGNLVELNF